MPIDAAKLLDGTTPRPWAVLDCGNYAEWEVVKPDPATTEGHWYVGQFFDGADGGSAEANARLFFAAPTLATEHIALTAEVERFTKLAEGLAGAGKAFLQYEGHRVYCGHAPDYIKPCVCGFNDADASFRTALTAWENRDV